MSRGEQQRKLLSLPASWEKGGGGRGKQKEVVAVLIHSWQTHKKKGGKPPYKAFWHYPNKEEVIYMLKQHSYAVPKYTEDVPVHK